MHYENVPAPPTHWDAKNVMIRMLEGIGFRYAHATAELPDHLADYQIAPDVMSMIEVYRHIYELLWWISRSVGLRAKYDKSINSLSAYRTATDELCYQLQSQLVQMSDEEVSRSVLHLRRNDTYYPIWYFINGPLSDSLTHIGQILSWRRAAGYPCSYISMLDGKARKK